MLESAPLVCHDAPTATEEFTGVDLIEFKIAQFTDHVVQHPALMRCIASMRTLHSSATHRSSRSGSDVALGPPRGMLITGLTGTGKSTISRHYAQQFPRYDLEDRTIIPVLRVELPGQPRANVIAEQLLVALGDPLPKEGSGEFRLERAKKLFRACGVSLIIIDEIQHLTDNLDDRTRNIAADTLKNLMNVGIPVVFIGLPSARSYFVRNQQLGRRCTPKIRLSPFTLGTDKDRREFMTMLKSLHLLLPLAGPSALIDPDCTQLLYLASHGLLGQLTQLTEAALRIALTHKDGQLTREHFRIAFEETIFPDCGQARNPFHERFNGKPLTGVDEPYNGLVS